MEFVVILGCSDQEIMQRRLQRGLKYFVSTPWLDQHGHLLKWLVLSGGAPGRDTKNNNRNNNNVSNNNNDNNNNNNNDDDDDDQHTVATEAEKMKEMVLTQYPELLDQIICENKSVNTVQNLLFSRQLILQAKARQFWHSYTRSCKLTICTSSSHIQRVMMLSHLIFFGPAGQDEGTVAAGSSSALTGSDNNNNNITNNDSMLLTDFDLHFLHTNQPIEYERHLVEQHHLKRSIEDFCRERLSEPLSFSSTSVLCDQCRTVLWHDLRKSDFEMSFDLENDMIVIKTYNQPTELGQFSLEPVDLNVHKLRCCALGDDGYIVHVEEIEEEQEIEEQEGEEVVGNESKYDQKTQEEGQEVEVKRNVKVRRLFKIAIGIDLAASVPGWSLLDTRALYLRPSLPEFESKATDPKVNGFWKLIRGFQSRWKGVHATLCSFAPLSAHVDYPDAMPHKVKSIKAVAANCVSSVINRSADGTNWLFPYTEAEGQDPNGLVTDCKAYWHCPTRKEAGSVFIHFDSEHSPIKGLCRQLARSGLVSPRNIERLHLTLCNNQTEFEQLATYCETNGLGFIKDYKDSSKQALPNWILSSLSQASWSLEEVQSLTENRRVRLCNVVQSLELPQPYDPSAPFLSARLRSHPSISSPSSPLSSSPSLSSSSSLPSLDISKQTITLQSPLDAATVIIAPKTHPIQPWLSESYNKTRLEVLNQVLGLADGVAIETDFDMKKVQFYRKPSFILFCPPLYQSPQSSSSSSQDTVQEFVNNVKLHITQISTHFSNQKLLIAVLLVCLDGEKQSNALKQEVQQALADIDPPVLVLTKSSSLEIDGSICTDFPVAADPKKTNMVDFDLNVEWRQIRTGLINHHQLTNKQSTASILASISETLVQHEQEEAELNHQRLLLQVRQKELYRALDSITDSPSLSTNKPPEFWSSFQNGAYQVRSTTNEGRKCLNTFFSGTSANRADILINEIFRLQDVDKWQNYQIWQQQEMIRQVSRTSQNHDNNSNNHDHKMYNCNKQHFFEEQWVWYGTNANVAQRITESQAFDLQAGAFNAQGGTFYSEPEKAIEFCSPDFNQVHYLFLVRLFPGAVIDEKQAQQQQQTQVTFSNAGRGFANTRSPQQQQQQQQQQSFSRRHPAFTPSPRRARPAHHTVDSPQQKTVVDSIAQPTAFQVYSVDQIYAAYKISFRLAGRPKKRPKTKR